MNIKTFNGLDEIYPEKVDGTKGCLTKGCQEL